MSKAHIFTDNLTNMIYWHDMCVYWGKKIWHLQNLLEKQFSIPNDLTLPPFIKLVSG